MQNYRFLVSHDNGSFTAQVPSFSAEEARDRILAMEGCPSSAVELIEEMNTKEK